MDKDTLANTHKVNNKKEKIVKKETFRKHKLNSLKARIQKKVELKQKPNILKESSNKINEKVTSESTKIQKKQAPLKKFLQGNVFKCTHAKTEKGKTLLTLQPLMYNVEEGRIKLMGVIVNGPKKIKKKKQKVDGTDEYILPLSDAVKSKEKSGKVSTSKGTKEKSSTEQKSKRSTGITKKTDQMMKVINNKIIGQRKIGNR
ncbi:uncharacterized protein LOC130899936 [Diorhabda carinulata]|uniref:uncharacterized protein LOC130899936 n=1 Tax=Diorhabda carinulata TaxID=1163345 RepID=UPI0025A1CA40|nr:uncharacterized protein LOC130899936 [Diorhabda carinulata]XP_057666119.1 uncharacterized protein LOC130899936 [Diorhabda carinulata]